METVAKQKPWSLKYKKKKGRYENYAALLHETDQ